MQIRVPSYAKINWFLDVKGKRSDGFHEILTLFQTISLSDQLSFQLCSKNIQLETEGIPLAAERDNLVCRAAELLRRKSGCDKGARILLRKRIPMAAGLGGGSSNAAVTLLVLNRLWDCRQSLQDLGKLAAELGSDVPYFLFGGACIGWGRGTETLPLEELDTERKIVLVYPGFGVPTATAYSLLNKPEIESPSDLTRDCLRHTIRRSGEIIDSGDYSRMSNDFEGPVFKKFPDFSRIIGELNGDRTGKFMLSGSGSTIIGVGDSSFFQGVFKSLERVENEFQGLEAFRCQTVSGKSYQAEYEDFFSYAAANS